MKKIFILIAGTFLCSVSIAQDTLTVHKQGVKTKYPLIRIDSITFKANNQGVLDSLRIYDNRFPVINSIIPKRIVKHNVSQIDSLTFQKADTLDYTSANGFDVLVNAAYTFPSSWYGKIEGFALAEVGTDIWIPGQGLFQVARTVTETKEIFLYQNLKNNDVLTRLWKQMYSAVNVCNMGVKIVNDNNFPPNDTRTVRMAELRFWRAFYYWNIVETWGGVHLTTEPFYKPNLKDKQSPLPLLLPVANKNEADQFYTLIFSDLQYAVEHLPVTGLIPGRITKPIAEAFLARMYLTRNMNTEARDLAKKVIQNYNYSLVPDYSSLWDMKKQNNPEVIWSYNFSINDVYNGTSNLYGYGYEDQSLGRGRNNAHSLFVGKYDSPVAADSLKLISKADEIHWPMQRDVRNGLAFNRFAPTPYLLNLFDETKDARYKGSFQTVWYSNKPVTSDAAPKKFAKGDTALVVSKNPLVSPKYYALNYSSLFESTGRSKDFQNITITPNLIKHMDSTRFTNVSQGPGQLGDGNIQSFREEYIIRLPEMYLIAAEAEMKLGNQAASKENINAVRRRAALTPALQTAMEVTGNVDIDFILDERARELAGEYLRWFDLKRTGKLLEKVKRNNPDIGDLMTETNLVRPVPQPQLDYMKGGNLTQNPGY